MPRVEHAGNDFLYWLYNHLEGKDVDEWSEAECVDLLQNYGQMLDMLEDSELIKEPKNGEG